MKKTLFILLVILSVSSCAFQTHYLQSGSTTYEPVDPDAVEIHLRDIEKEYIVIGVVTADAVGNGERTAELLKQKAASLGATAVIKTELTKVSSGYIRTGMSGIAVKLK